MPTQGPYPSNLLWFFMRFPLRFMEPWFYLKNQPTYLPVKALELRMCHQQRVLKKQLVGYNAPTLNFGSRKTYYFLFSYFLGSKHIDFFNALNAFKTKWATLTETLLYWWKRSHNHPQCAYFGHISHKVLRLKCNETFLLVACPATYL